MALDVESFIQNHGLERPAVIGHSMGAKTAMTLALRYPNLVSKVVAIDNGPIHLPLKSYFPKYLQGMAKAEGAKVKSHLEADAILREYETSPSVRLWLLSNFVKSKDQPHLHLRIPLDILEKAMGPLGDFPDKDAFLKFNSPTLFLRGLQSHYIPDTAFPLISSLFPQSKIVDIDCGHWIVQDRPEEFRKAVVDFLRDEE
ncbi:hypothetical protein PENARI_c003G02016 [Penicillium arizonense]|uniref:AB hydrolase-1 domain-containing protein n=1 Tax=Penicillium arizonense TaxID=1835702 RepID=A0A1F5LT17_PENAI|nr:hypothetical protein PENARI_c003G02016 [Penicillium arizonense]OGE56236.1 hypothetical protein PENARI_c003G02016 [Penicillium arizonense]